MLKGISHHSGKKKMRTSPFGEQGKGDCPDQLVSSSTVAAGDKGFKEKNIRMKGSKGKDGI